MPLPPTRRTIIARLLRLTNLMIRNLETDMKKEGAKPGEAETAVLGRLVAAMAKLIDLEAAESHMVTGTQTKELLDIRNKLVRRIDELKRQ